MEDNKAFEAMMADDLPEGVYKLAPGLTAEEMLSVFFDEDALLEQPQKIYRLQGTNRRLYYTFDENQEPVFYTSVTTMIKFTMPTSPHLIKWIADMGYDEAELYKEERASYGTFLHSELATLLITKKYDFETLPDRLKAYVDKEKLAGDFINHADELKKDILAFAQFMVDCEVEPLAIELVLAHPRDGYAGAIDLYCQMTVEKTGFWGEHYKTGANAGKPKATKKRMRIKAIVDFKSGRKGFHEENEVQLEAYKQLWEENFKEHKVDAIYNWSPKAWRTGPSYNLKDQTEARSRAKLEHLVNLARIENDRKENSVIVISGNLDITKGTEANFKEFSLAELVKKKEIKKQNKKA